MFTDSPIEVELTMLDGSTESLFVSRTPGLQRGDRQECQEWIASIRRDYPQSQRVRILNGGKDEKPIVDLSRS